MLAFHPARRQVPANTARLHLTFSAPMRAGSVGPAVAVRSARCGTPLPLETAERWNLERTRLTVVFDPRADAPGLRVGEHYILEVGPGALGADGAPLEGHARFAFLAGPPEIQGPDPDAWKLATPAPGTLDPLVVAFPRPMDLLGLERLLRVLDPEGRVLKGTATPSPNLTSWRWDPTAPWGEGLHGLRLDGDLRDLCGHRLEVEGAGPADGRTAVMQAFAVGRAEVGTAPRAPAPAPHPSRDLPVHA